MPNFPRTELEILALAQNLKTGLAAHPTDFPDPPVVPLELTSAVSALQTAMDACLAARAAAEAATTAKLTAIEDLVTLMKKDLRYAENAVGNNDEKLKTLGWGARKDAAPVPPPGQTLELMVYPQGEGWLDLGWQAPVDGGKVTVYTIRRRLRSETAWTDVASSLERRISLQNQPRGVELEYIVVAVNRAGEGPASNTVMVVL